MSYGGTPYPTRYGGQASMPMPNIPNNQHTFPPYPAPANPYAQKGGPTYPAPTSHNVSYQGMSQSTPTSSEIDAEMKQLTEDLIGNVIQSAQNEDLKVLINNDEKLMELIRDSQITKDLNKKREEMAGFNKDQAAANLSLKPEFELLKSTLQELSQRQNELRDRYLDLQNKLGNNAMSADSVLGLLQVATGEQETISEDIKSSFYDGDLPIEDFIKQFVDGRKLYQLRKIKTDKLKLMLQQQHPHVASFSRPGVPGYMTNQPGYGAQYPSYNTR